jgi:glycosyltransferase involved in cell wall biosynthesis/SAM-dependent methyltransferase
MIHLFVDASAASSGSGPTYVRNVVPHLAARTDLRSTILVSPLLRQEFRDHSNVSFVEFADESTSAVTRFARAQRSVPELVRRSGANVLLSAGNIALFRSPVPQILLSGNALYTSGDFFRDVRQRGDYQLWLDTKLKGQIAKWSVRTADRTVAPSQAFADEIKRWTGVSALAIHHGFDRNLFFRDTEPLPAELKQKLERTRDRDRGQDRGQDKDELRLLFVSHYNYYRNFETLIRALVPLRKLIEPRRLSLFLTCRLEPGANPGSFRPEAAARLVQELGVGSNLVELGAVPYHLLHHVYRACDLYVTPAYVETFAHPLVEAMAAGLPVVASDLAVHHEVCGDAALYFPAFSPELLAETVFRVAQSPEVSERSSVRGLERSKDFSWKKHVDQIVALAEELLSPSPIERESLPGKRYAPVGGDSRLRLQKPDSGISTSPEYPAKDAIAYHRELAAGWDQRYKKPAFKARLRAFEECLAGRDLHGQEWLDAGCGSGTLARYLVEAGASVLGVDAAEEMIAMARELADQNVANQAASGWQLRFQHVATIAHLPLADQSLDGILCSSVLEYVPDAAACLAEFARVLRPQGLLVVSVANRNSLVRKAQVETHRLGRFLRQRWCTFLDYSHNEYAAEGFRALLQKQGFLTSKVIPFGSPIPHWLQRREFGGSLLAFAAVRE